MLSVNENISEGTCERQAHINKHQTLLQSYSKPKQQFNS